MRLQNVGEHSNRSYASASTLRSSGVGYEIDQRGVWEEQTWRCLSEADRRATIGADILVSRWVDSSNLCRHEKYVPLPDRHIIAVSLNTTRLRLTRGTHTIYDGIMPAGTLHVTGPSQPLTADFDAPCEFIHFHVSNDYLRTCQRAAQSAPCEVVPDLNDLVMRDPLAELLGRTLIKGGNIENALYAESVGQTLVMHIARTRLRRRTASALQKWRLQRVQEYIETHLDGALSLSDLASVAGLSRMHFAAQFRAATGCRPHEYVLSRRIENAKTKLSNTDMPIVQVALSIGFNAQSHFSTVFKRFTGEAPARWRRMVASAPDLYL